MFFLFELVSLVIKVLPDFDQQLYNNEEERSKVMGYVLGGIAAGVLIGYPLGGVMFEFFGEAAPFVVVSFASGALLGNV